VSEHVLYDRPEVSGAAAPSGGTPYAAPGDVVDLATTSTVGAIEVSAAIATDPRASSAPRLTATVHTGDTPQTLGLVCSLEVLGVGGSQSARAPVQLRRFVRVSTRPQRATAHPWTAVRAVLRTL